MPACPVARGPFREAGVRHLALRQEQRDRSWRRAA